jgi:N-acyl-D-aspartate/D-glutamate deacylase
VIFDAKAIQDKADFDQPHQYPEGIAAVIVNGAVTIVDGVHTGVLKGKVLRA